MKLITRINTAKTPFEQATAIVHESIHGFYRNIFSHKTKDYEIREQPIFDEEQRFIIQNLPFMYKLEHHWQIQQDKSRFKLN